MFQVISPEFMNFLRIIAYLSDDFHASRQLIECLSQISTIIM